MANENAIENAIEKKQETKTQASDEKAELSEQELEKITGAGGKVSLSDFSF